MNVIDWHTDPTTGETINQLLIVIEDPGIKQWMEIAEVRSFRVDGTMENFVPFDVAETNRAVHGYFAWGVEGAGGFSARPAWLDGQFINWQRTHIIAPPGTKCFRLWLRRGVVAKVYPDIEDNRNPFGVIRDALGNVLFQLNPRP